MARSGPSDRRAWANRTAPDPRDTVSAPFQQAVRALHTAGATPTEIADELEISHHTARQIPGDYRLNCTFCGRNRSELRKLICGPDGVAICCDCVAPATTVVRHGTPAADGRTTLSPTPAGSCSFCGTHDRTVATHGTTSICAQCVDLHHEILAESRPPVG